MSAIPKTINRLQRFNGKGTGKTEIHIGIVRKQKGPLPPNHVLHYGDF